MAFLKKLLQPVLLVGLVIAAASSMACVSSVPELPATEVSRMVENDHAIIIDVREQDEWDAQHIPGAIHIPLGEVNNRLSELASYKDQPIVMQCRSGKRSAQAANILKEAGFKHVLNLKGGIIAWSKASLPTI